MADSEEQQMTEEQAEIQAMFDATLKKKKKKTTTKSTKTATGESAATATDGDLKTGADGATAAQSSASAKLEGSVFELDPPNYTYEQLLERVVDFVTQNNPELVDKKRSTMRPPQLSRVGTKKTLWTNFQEICGLMKRNPDHVFQFMMAELGTEGSIDGNKRLVIRGKFVPKYIESLLRKYIIEYVSCSMCHSLNTTLTRDQVSRLYFVQCQDCGCSRSVAQIRAGFHAQTRADRRAIRNAA